MTSEVSSPRTRSRQGAQVESQPDLITENEHLRAEVENLNGALRDSQEVLVRMERSLRQAREELEALRSSRVGRITVSLQRGGGRLAPTGTARRAVVHAVVRGTAVLIADGPRAFVTRIERRLRRSSLDDAAVQYRLWRRLHAPTTNRLLTMQHADRSFAYRPKVSVLMPVHDPPLEWLQSAVDSVRGQIYETWELCIADDASSNQAVVRRLRDLASADSRIRLVERRTNGGISEASQSALVIASGEYVTLLDHDDVLERHALHTMIAALQNQPDADVVYGDEDKVLPHGTLGKPMFKPDWSPDLLLSCNYITHAVLFRRELAVAAGGFRAGFDGSQDHDLLLRVTERTDRIAHVADVLYHWRVGPGSTAASEDAKPMAREAGRRAVEEAVRRRGTEARVEYGRHPGFYNVRYAIRGQPSVSVIIPTRDRLKLLQACIASVEALTTYSKYEIVILDNDSSEPETLEFLRRSPHRVVRVEGRFNYSTLVNRAATVTTSDHLLFLNNDTAVVTSDWLEAMLEHSQRSEIGAVGARLLFPDGRVQHEGIMCGGLFVASNIEIGWPLVVRDVSAVTGACLMTRREVFESVGGFDESLAVAFNDVDYCFRVRAAGKRIIFTPLAELVHHESASRGALHPEADEARFVQRWGDRQHLRDPYINENVLLPVPLRLRLD
ncbi:MAG: glycosyltransferase family 2 protein [Candidatus Dormibacteraeota bacterium]|nr:glycosyltransferase family 2 protein [Candidatus Dormibacteraeota bacterium]